MKEWRQKVEKKAEFMVPGESVDLENKELLDSSIRTVRSIASFLKPRQSYVSGGIGIVGSLRPYFQVTPRYVVRKLFVLLFPFLHRNWSRLPRSEGGGLDEFEESVNEPDIYIPLMALETYILMVGISNGIVGTFDPEQLGITMTRIVLFVSTPALFATLGVYLVGRLKSTPILDLVSVTSYSMVYVVVSIAFSTLLGWPLNIYLSLANAFYLIRALRSYIFPESRIVYRSSKRRLGFLALLVAINITSFFYITRIGFFKNK